MSSFSFIYHFIYSMVATLSSMQGTDSEAMPAEQMVVLSGRAFAAITKLRGDHSRASGPGCFLMLSEFILARLFI